MEKVYSCLIVDDDRMSLKIIQSLVDKTPFLQTAGAFQNPFDAFKILSEQKIDILFLDVEMPEMTGLELMDILSYRPQIILTTSKNNYAVQGFEYEVADFLLKPIDNYPRFLKAVRKAKEKLEPVEPTINKNSKNNIFIKVDSLLVNFNLQDIIYIEAFGDYIKIHTQEKTYIAHSKLRTVEETLPPYEFARIHRSYIVRLDRIKNIDPSNLEVEKMVIPISNSYRGNLLAKINLLS